MKKLIANLKVAKWSDWVVGTAYVFAAIIALPVILMAVSIGCVFVIWDAVVQHSETGVWKVEWPWS